MSNRKIVVTFILILIILHSFLIKGFSQNKGTPFIRNYLPEEYKAAGQNWAAVKNNDGLMYFANNDGVLEFDGINWRKIETPGIALSLTIDSTGTIYVGLMGDFGYLKTNSDGIKKYVSLKNKIPEEHRSFSHIWSLQAAQNKVLFHNRDKIFLLQNDTIKVLLPQRSFREIFKVNNHIFIHEPENWLSYLKEDSIVSIKDGNIFAKRRIMEIFQYDTNKILVIEENHINIFEYNLASSPIVKLIPKPEKFKAIDNFLAQTVAYSGSQITDKTFAIGTVSAGIITFDHLGNIIKIYNTDNGLHSNYMLSLIADKDEQLWATTNNGISLIQNDLPYNYYSRKNGINGGVMCINVFDKKLYVGTDQFLLIKNENRNFEQVGGGEMQNWQLLKFKDALLLAHNIGVYDIKNQKVTLLDSINLTNAYVLYPLKYQSNKILVGTSTGIRPLEYNNKQWQLRHHIKGFDMPVYSMVKDNEGYLWVFTYPDLYKLKLNTQLDSVIYKQNCSDSIYNLPDGWIVPYKLNNGEVVFGTQKKGVYRYLPNQDKFELHPIFHEIKDGIFPIVQDKNGNIWFDEWKKDGTYEKGVLWNKNGEYEMFKTPFLKFKNWETPGVFSIYPHSDSIIYFGTEKGLIEYFPHKKKNYDIPFNTLIRTVLVGDSLIYGGSKFHEINDIKVLNYKENNLTFHYAATFYEESEKNLYSYRLIGMDTTWSKWLNDSKKEYTNLHEGDYVFEVKSKNIYKKYGTIARYAFTIGPPWHRTILIYLTYVVLLIGAIWIFIRLYTKRLVNQKLALEQKIKERTQEIASQKEEIQLQAEELRANNEKLIELDNFKESLTGTIVHDLKNPLNVIINTSEKEPVSGIRRIKNTGKQMLNMVLNILDVYKYESSKMLLDRVNFNLNKTIDSAISEITFLAEQKSLTIQKEIDSEIFMDGDEQIMKRVIVNLLTNAIKYSPLNERLIISLTPDKQNHKVKVSITDKGKGIPQEQQSKIFEKYQQLESKASGDVRSTGLGLTFCKMAIEAHKGVIGVESEIGKGSSFWFEIDITQAGVLQETLQEKVADEKDVRIEFDEKEKSYLLPIIEKLKQHVVYETTDITKILENVDDSFSQNISLWKQEVEACLFNMNEKKYKELLNIT